MIRFNIFTGQLEDVPAPGGASGATSFVQLTDVPSSYAGSGGLGVAVKEDETGLEFVEMPADGADGADGEDGADGADGEDGRNAGFKFTYLTNTANTDPGAGKLKFNDVPLDATNLRISETDGDGNSVEGIFTLFSGFYILVRGYIIVQKDGDPSTAAIYKITSARTDNGAWDNFTMYNVSSQGTFANNDVVRVQFMPAGHDASNPVTSVAGRTGDVVLVATDISDSTDVGRAFVKLTNPGAVSFVRLNADNSVTARSATNFKTDLLLNLVENTALSTWAGSTNLTTLGTITTGVWNGSILGVAYTEAQIKTVTGTTDRIAITGTATDPIFNIASGYVGQASITTVGTIGSGTWNGGVISGQYGGTGVANTGKTITLGGNVTTSGAFALTLTLSATTSVTLPTSGTLATLAGAESLTNKKLGSLTSNGFVKTGGGDGTLSVDVTDYQPLDPDLTAIAALTTTSFGRAFLALADQAGGRSYLGLGTAALADTGTSSGNVPVLDGTGKIPTSLLPSSVLGDVQFQNTWNATTNTPTIPAAASGNKGWYYVVATAGSTSIDGETDWKVGDWLVSNGSTWNKIDNTDLVTSVAGRVGAVTLSSTDLTDATTVGLALVALANPSAISFIRINADNSVTTRSAANFKSDLSLNNVENTALSTWAGTTNITTLGTIGTGTWQGTAIATTYIANSAVTYAKIQDISATSRVLGRMTAGAGATEELTLSQVLDFASGAGSPALGDILYRGSTTWARREAGTSGQFLQTRGTGASPIWSDLWQGQVIAGLYGGTGVANNGRTITLAGNLATSGAFALTLTVSAATNVTFPTTGTLATLAGNETLLNKSLTGPLITGSILTSSILKDSTFRQIVNGGPLIVCERFTDTAPAGSCLTLYSAAAATLFNLDLGGIVTLGTWQGGIIAGAYGGTGVANTSKTITIGGNFVTSGAFAVTLTASATTNVTLPTAGTLATLAGTESLTNKKLGSLTNNGFVKTSGGDGTLSVDTSTYLTAAGAVTSIAGTAAEITASASVGAVTLSLPSALTFTGKTITGGTFKNITLAQVANGDSMIFGQRITDTAPSGYFLNFLTAAGVQLFAVDVLGAITATGISTFIGAFAVRPVMAANTSVDGSVLENTVAATSGNQSYSPRRRWTAQGWKTTATAASQTVDAIMELQPIQSTTAPQGNLVVSMQTNAGGYIPVGVFKLGGVPTNEFCEIGVTNSNATGGGSGAIFRATASTASFQFACWGAGRVATRFGVTIGNYCEVASQTGSGIIFGSFNNAPVIIGTNALGRIFIPASGGVNIGGTSDPGDTNLQVTGKTFFGAAAQLKSYTVATLPTGVLGDTACVTDALAPTFLAVVVGGGAVKTPVFFNGANWVGY